MRRENRKKESHLLVEQIIKEELTAEQLQNQAADSDDDGKYQYSRSNFNIFRYVHDILSYLSLNKNLMQFILIVYFYCKVF